MIHFFLTFSRNAADSPFAARLDELGVDYRIMAGEVRHRYKHRAWMIFVGRPMTAWFAIRAAWRSLVVEKPAPSAVVVWTHIEALIVAAMRWLTRRRNTRIVLVGFILTSRSGALHNALRKLYFDTVFSVVDLTVVHSSVEVARYVALYRGRRSSFTFIPWGSHIDTQAATNAGAQDADADTADVLCAGRSGRDYKTLYQALGGTPYRVRIVCDLAQALEGCTPAANVRVLDNCYGDRYIHELRRARCIAIPLGVNDISAGQMVLLQAMDSGKPVVITRTATSVDYVTDGHDALLVEPADAQALRQAVARILGEPELAARLGANARSTFAARFTLPAFVTQLVDRVNKLDARAGTRKS